MSRMSARHRIAEGIVWVAFALATACTARPADRGAASPAPISSGLPVSAAVEPLAAPIPEAAAGPPEAAIARGAIGPVAATDAGAPLPPDPGVDTCAAAISEGMGDYARFFSNRTPVASTRLLLRIFARACRTRFALWAEAADRASHVGRSERSRILGRAVADVCPGAENASIAADLVAACPSPYSTNSSLLVWRRLDAGTYALIYALAHAGLRSVLLDELILQASLTPELDR
jgi:hypothetical protein